MTESRAIKLLIFVYMVYNAAYLIAGQLHLDEGAYLCAAKLVYQGQLPYRDFFFLQPPIHPYIYGLIQLISPGLATARLTSIIAGCLTCLLLYRMGRKLGPPHTSLIFLALFASNPFQLYFFSITRLYSITALLLAGSVYAISTRPVPTWRNGSIAMIFMVMTASTRLTGLPMLLILGLYIFIKGESWRDRLAPQAAGLTAAAAIWTPFVLHSDVERVWFNILGMNLSLHSNNLAANIMQKLRASVQFIDAYFFLLLLWIPLILLFLKQMRGHPARRLLSMIFSRIGLIWTLTVTMLAVHTTAKIYQVSYQTFITPLLMWLVAYHWNSIYSAAETREKSILKFILSAGCLLTILSYGTSSLQVIKGKPALLAMRDQARFVKENTLVKSLVFSADSALVTIEADRTVLPGMAGSDLFPDWSTEKCNYFNVLNFQIMNEYINQQRADLVVVGDRSFTLALPYLTPISQDLRASFIRRIESRYKLKAVYPNLFIKGTQTYYYVPKKMDEN